VLWSYLQQHPTGRVFTAPFDVILSDFDVVEPDLLYLSRERMAQIETSPWVRGAPDLVVEILSERTIANISGVSDFRKNHSLRVPIEEFAQHFRTRREHATRAATTRSPLDLTQI
jgi:Uma2 family endonuclease